MEITWYGLSCFRLAERGAATVVTDPYDHRTTGYSPLNLTADIVTISHEAPGHSYVEAVKGSPYLVSGPGEYEVGGVFITGIQTGGLKSSAETRNTLYVFDYNALVVAHLGDVNRVPTQSEIEDMGPVHVALIPVGGSLNAARAAEVVSLLEPNLVIPMHYATPECSIPLESLSKFLKEMGAGETEPLPSIKVTNTSLPDETQVMILSPQRG
jgi:L-ascorbate metabolism protein UlaG (beta-lactamase superfamily)